MNICIGIIKMISNYTLLVKKMLENFLSERFYTVYISLHNGFIIEVYVYLFFINLLSR